MKRKIRVVAGLFLFALATRPIAAQDKPPAIPPAKEAKIHELLKRTGAGKLGVQMMDQLISNFQKSMPDVPGGFWEKFRGEVKAEDLEAMIVPVYAKHFDEMELQGIIDFYGTPAGAKLVQELPAISMESMELGRKWGEDLAKKIIERLKKDGYKLDA